MDFVNKTFQALYDRLYGSRDEHSATKCILEDHGSRLTYLAASLLPISFHIRPSEDSWCIRENELTLPHLVAVFDSVQKNYDVLKFRLVVEAVLLEKILDQVAVPSQFVLSESLLRDLMEGSAMSPAHGFALGVLIDLQQRVSNNPGKDDIANRLLTFMPPVLSERTLIRLKNPDAELTSQEERANKGRTTLKKRAAAEITEIELKDEEMNPLTHTFEKLHTLDDHQGGLKQIDSDDDLKDQSRALDDLKLDKIVRTNKAGGGVIDAGFIAGAHTAVNEEGSVQQKPFMYDEWNGRSGRYKNDWCKVYEQIPSDDDSASHFEKLNFCRIAGKTLQQRLYTFANEYRWRRRQPDGPEIDLEAYIDTRVEQLRGGIPSDKIYRRFVRSDFDFALTILCDSSMSTDSWVANTRIMDLIKETILTMSYALDGVACAWSVAAFNSFTRTECQYQLLKDFEDPVEVLRQRALSLTPTGYTRLGPALRHAGARAMVRRARRNLILIVTDSKPTDYDYYDGNYGVADVRKAVGELRAKNIDTFAVTISDSPQDKAIKMFGSDTAFCWNSPQLTQTLFHFFEKFLAPRR